MSAPKGSAGAWPASGERRADGVIASAMADAEDDLSMLEVDALVARLALVKERVLDLMDQPAAPVLTPEARADTEAVIDECAIRLLRPLVLTSKVPGPSQGDLYAGALDLVVAARSQRDELGREVKRLRGLIKAMVPVALGKCPWCGVPEIHKVDCPWSAIFNEANKP